MRNWQLPTNFKTYPILEGGGSYLIKQLTNLHMSFTIKGKQSCSPRKREGLKILRMGVEIFLFQGGGIIFNRASLQK